MNDENMNEEKYLVIYGHRRFEAAKKLGWKKISCIFPETQEQADIEIEKIFARENMRSKETDITDLMVSLKYKGLLQPIGLSRNMNIDKKTFLTLQAHENLIRKETSPIELGKVINEFKNNFNMNFEEIDIALGNIGINRIKSAHDIFLNTPLSMQNSVGYNAGVSIRKRSLISQGTMNIILNSEVLKKDKKLEIMLLAKKENLTKDKVATILRMIKNHPSFELEEIYQLSHRYKRINIDIYIDNSLAEEVKNNNDNKSWNKIIMLAAMNKIRLPKKFFLGNGDL